jgi:hypothetical protein
MVELKSVEAGQGKPQTVTLCPRMTVPEGQGCTVSFDGHEAVLGQYLCGSSSQGGCPSCRKQPCSGGVVHVQVSGEMDGSVDLDLNVQQSEVQDSSKEGIEVRNHGLHVVRPVKLDKPMKLVLDRGPEGSMQRWIEVTVSAPPAEPNSFRNLSSNPVSWQLGMPAAQPTPVLAMPPCSAAQDSECPAETLMDLVGEVLSEIVECFFPCNDERCPAPNACYLQHPPQYYPPAPAFPLARELAVQQAIGPVPAFACPPIKEVVIRESSAARPSPECLAAPRECPHYASNSSPNSVTPIQTCAATLPARTLPPIHVSVMDGEPRLEITCGGGARMCCKKLDLKMSDSQPMTLAAASGQVQLQSSQVEARANVVTTDQKDLLVLEGKVRLRYNKDGQSADIVADRIEVSLSEGTLKIKP